MSLLLYHHVQREVTKLYNKKLQVGINAGALPCARLACATSGDGMTKEPHSSPKHYKPNAIQQVLEGQEYRFAGDIKRQRVQQAWGKLLHRLNRTAEVCP